MRNLLAAACILAAIVPAATAHAAVQAVPAAQAPSEADALALARAFSPSDLRLAGEIRVMRESFLPTLRQNADVAAMLEAFPTLGNELVEAMIPHMPLYIEEYDQRFFPRATAIIRASLSAEDVRSVTAFYRSPLGRKMITTGAANVDGSGVAAKGLADGVIQQSDLDRQALQAGIAVIGQLSPAERAEFLSFSASAAGRKFLGLRPQLTALALELVNNPGPRFQEVTERTMLETMSRVTGVDLSPAAQTKR